MCLKRITIATKTGGGREGGRQAEVGGGGRGEWERGGRGSSALSDQIGTTVIINCLRSIAVRLHIREKTQLSGALLPVSLYEGAKVK